jgi:glycosyltransferase involved in cell wall biosynthesis
MRPEAAMKVLQIHNFYQQPGGEDAVYAAEFDLLKANGHDVRQYAVDNDAISGMRGIQVAWRTIWNQKSYREIRQRIRQQLPDVIHAHNTFPLISPAVYYAAEAEGVPVVQTLHNYRLICPAATLFRNGHVCEDCVQTAVAYKAVWHGCYHESRPGTAAVATMLASHKLAGTWNAKIHAYIALTQFARNKLAEGGLPANRIFVKPNFLGRDPGTGEGRGGFALFVGRLSREKGLNTILRAWEQVREFPLKIAGVGPLAEFVQKRAAEVPNVEYLGRQGPEEILQLMKNATVLVFPSEWYEGLPMTIIESLACGTPVLASRLGSMIDLVRSGETGYHFEAGDADQLAKLALRVFRQQSEMKPLRQRARKFYEENFQADRNYQILLQIYERAASSKRQLS